MQKLLHANVKHDSQAYVLAEFLEKYNNEKCDIKNTIIKV